MSPLAERILEALDRGPMSQVELANALHARLIDIEEMLIALRLQSLVSPTDRKWVAAP